MYAASAWADCVGANDAVGRADGAANRPDAAAAIRAVIRMRLEAAPVPAAIDDVAEEEEEAEDNNEVVAPAANEDMEENGEDATNNDDCN